MVLGQPGQNNFIIKVSLRNLLGSVFKLGKAFKSQSLISSGFDATPVGFLDSTPIYCDIEKGYEILNNQFRFNDQPLRTEDWYQPSTLSPQAANWFNTFSWLHDVKVINTDLSQKFIQLCLHRWLATYASVATEDKVLNPLILAQRVINWLSCSELKSSLSQEDYTNFLTSLNMQKEILGSYGAEVHKEYGFYGCFIVYVALVFVGMAYAQAKLQESYLQKLLNLLEDNILPDGGVMGEAPSTMLSTLEYLLLLIKNLSATNQSDLKAKFRVYLDKITCFIKTLRYKDKKLGVFNRGYEEKSAKIQFLLSASGVSSGVFKQGLPYSGYHFIASPNINLAFKTLGIPNNDKDFALQPTNSLMSQELSVKGRRIFVNNSCGWEKGLSPYACTGPILVVRKEVVPFRIKSKIDCKVTTKRDDHWLGLDCTYSGMEHSHGFILHKHLSLDCTLDGVCLLGEEALSFRNKKVFGSAWVNINFLLHPTVSYSYNSTLDNIEELHLNINNANWLFTLSVPGIVRPVFYHGSQNEIAHTHVLSVRLSVKSPVLTWRLIQQKALNQVESASRLG